MLNKQFHNLKRFSIFLFGLLSFISTVKGITIIPSPALMCQPLTIVCEIKDLKHASYVLLTNNGTLVQGYDVKKNKTECPEDSQYSKECSSGMNGSRLVGNKMLFEMDRPWLWLNQSVPKCEVRYLGHRDNDHAKGKIDLRSCQDGNSSVTNSTPTTIPVNNCQCTNITGKSNVTTKNPNDATCKNTNSDDKTIIKIMGSIIGILVLLLAILLFISLYVCKCHENLPFWRRAGVLANQDEEVVMAERKTDSSNGNV